jgi:hypothetical protein
MGVRDARPTGKEAPPSAGRGARNGARSVSDEQVYKMIFRGDLARG